MKNKELQQKIVIYEKQSNVHPEMKTEVPEVEKSMGRCSRTRGVAGENMPTEERGEWDRRTKQHDMQQTCWHVSKTSKLASRR